MPKHDVPLVCRHDAIPVLRIWCWVSWLYWWATECAVSKTVIRHLSSDAFTHQYPKGGKVCRKLKEKGLNNWTTDKTHSGYMFLDRGWRCYVICHVSTHGREVILGHLFPQQDGRPCADAKCWGSLCQFNKHQLSPCNPFSPLLQQTQHILYIWRIYVEFIYLKYC